MPGRPATRISVVALALLVAGVAFTAGAAWSQMFSDVPVGTWSQPQIEWLAANGIATGYPDGTFRPRDPINREQVAVWLANVSDATSLADSATDPAPGNDFVHAATCDRGRRPVGGGGETVVPAPAGAALVMVSSAPWVSDEGGPVDSWRVRWQTADGSDVDPAEVRVWAVCAPNRSTAD